MTCVRRREGPASPQAISAKAPAGRAVSARRITFGLGPYAIRFSVFGRTGYSPRMASTDLQAHLEAELQRFPVPASPTGSPGRIDARPMFGTQAYLVRGKVFAALGGMGLLLKLPPERRQALLDAGTVGPFALQPGTAFGEWVAVSRDHLEATGLPTLLALVRESFDYVVLAPAKPRPPREQRHFRKRMY